MTPESEIAQLKEQVAELRREMNALRRFITIEFDETSKEPTNLNLRCCILSFSHPEAPARTQAYFMATKDGPSFTLHDSHEKPRIALSVEKDEVSLTLRTAEFKDAVELRIDEPSGRGQVAVFEAGHPRALMKADNQGGGAVSVVHDDGHPRVFLRSSLDRGEIHAVSPDMKTAIRIDSNTPFGGMLTVHGINGHAGVILSGTQLGGAVMVNDEHGKPVASLPAADFEKPEDGES